jgi:hypothetical protein
MARSERKGPNGLCSLSESVWSFKTRIPDTLSVCSFDPVEYPGQRSFRFRREHAFEGIFDVLGRDPPAIAEPDVTSEAERIGHVIIGQFPRMGDIGHKVEVLVEADETIEELCGDPAALDIGDQGGIERGRVIVQPEVEMARESSIVGPVAGDTGYDEQGDEEKAQEREVHPGLSPGIISGMR